MNRVCLPTAPRQCIPTPTTHPPTPFFFLFFFLLFFFLVGGGGAYSLIKLKHCMHLAYITKIKHNAKAVSFLHVFKGDNSPICRLRKL